jgi:hypothetical protein
MRKNPRACVEADEVVGQDCSGHRLGLWPFELASSLEYAALRLDADSLLDKRTLRW